MAFGGLRFHSGESSRGVISSGCFSSNYPTMKTKHAIVVAALLVLTGSNAAVVQAQISALSAPAGAAGNETGGADAVAVDFRVERPVRITQLGMFDSAGDGVVGSAVITVQLKETS